ncbi:annexin A13-like [Styela clava]|uniref:annexin A13-like n=1 Tax=Styela clava TaxID=7725 RepID=UPI0019393D57|nr:annexin A13-like [Styela clava]
MADEIQFVIEFTATLVDYADFNPDQDAEALREAMKGLGTEEKVIIAIVANRTRRQRLKIEETYKQKYGRDLKENLKSELSGDFEDVVLAMFYPPAEGDARFLHKAMCGVGTDEEALVEILATRYNNQIKDIKEAYKAKYEKELEKAIKGDTSGDFKRLLVILLQANRDETFAVDRDLAKAEAKLLIDAGVKYWGTDEAKFIEIFCNRSFPQIRATCYEYEKLAGHTMLKAVDKEFSGDMKKALTAIIQISDYAPIYFANRLHKAMCGVGTDDSTLIRIVTTRCEVDMGEIKKEFEKTYGKSLFSWIKDDTSGDYKRMLLCLIRDD